MTTGTVKFFDTYKGYGFIQPDKGGRATFVHASALVRAGIGTLEQKQRVSYDLQQDNHGKMSAANLREADKAGSSSKTGAR